MGLWSRTLCGLLVVAALLGPAQATSMAVSVVAATASPTLIPVGANPTGIAVDSLTHRVYVANSGSAKVSVVDEPTNKVIASVPVGLAPLWIAVNETTNRVFVANSVSGTVSVIDGSSNVLIAAPRLAPGVGGIAVDQLSDLVYVTNSVAGTLSILDGKTFGLVKTLRLAASPLAVAVNPALRRVYVTDAAAGTVVALDAVSDTVLARIPIGASPNGLGGLAVDESSGAVYAASDGTGTLSTIVGSTNVLVAITHVGQLPAGVAVSPGGRARIRRAGWRERVSSDGRGD